MCQFCSQFNEGMEPADNKLLGLNTGKHVGSSALHAVSPEQGTVQKDVSSPCDPLPSPTISLISCDSFASSCSDYSVDVNPYDGHNREDGGSESGQNDPRYRLPEGHLRKSSLVTSENAFEQSDDLMGNQKQGKNGFVLRNINWSSHDANNDDSTSSDESFDEADVLSPTYYDRDEIWDPPEPENKDDDKENSVTILDDDDDVCVNGDGSEWAMPSSLNSFEEGVPSSYRFKAEKQKAIEETMNGKFRNLVSQLLGKLDIDICDKKEESWVDIVTLLAWQAASFVRPAATEGNAMDPAGYVKIKCIAAGSRGESKLIKGVVFKKHAAHKHMATKYKSPRLLLIQGMLDQSSGSSGLSSFSSMISEDKVNMEDLMENLQACHPNVILVEKSASRDVLQKVLEMGVTLVLDMKLHRLERVARCTGSPILSSDVTFSQKLKHCDSLYFEKVVEEHAIVGEGGKKPCKTLMFLEGCPTRLGCTILLKGSNSEELKRIKCVLQCAVVMAYHFILETCFLVDQKAMFSTIAFGKAADILSADEQSTLVSETFKTYSGEPNAGDSSADGLKVPISSGDDEESSHVQESSSQTVSSCSNDIQISNGFYEEKSGHVKDISAKAAEIASSDDYNDKGPRNLQLVADDPSTVCREPHITTLSLASPSTSEAVEEVSILFPGTSEHVSTCIYLNGREPEAQTAVSVPVSPTEEAPERCYIKSKNSSGEDVSLHNDSQPFSTFSADAGETKRTVDDDEDCIKAKDEICSVLDSESILVLMSRRNASKGTICEQSHFSHIKFYRNFDVPLGKFLQDQLFNQTLKCKECGEPPEAHFYYYAHHNKQLTVRVKHGNKRYVPGESEGKLWMWSSCGKCQPDKEKVTKRVLISTAARGLSFGKFLELSFSSHSSFNRLSSCGHSFQKDFLYFFGLGSMVAMFRYSRVAKYTVSVPAQKLEFNSSINKDWLQHEIESVYTKGLLLFTELANYLTKIESRISGSNLVLNGLGRGFAGVIDMLKLERSEFEENIKTIGIVSEDLHNSVHKLLSLNRLRWEILLESCVWDRRLQLLFSSFTLPQPSVTVTNEAVQRQIDSKDDGSAGEAEGSQAAAEKVMQGQKILEEHRSRREVEGTQEVIEEAAQKQVDSEKDHTDGSVTASTKLVERRTESKHDSDEEVGVQWVADSGLDNAIVEGNKTVSHGEHKTSRNCADVEIQIEGVTGAGELSVKESPNGVMLQGCREQDSITLCIVEQNIETAPSGNSSSGLSLLQEFKRSTILPSHSCSDIESAQTDNTLSYGNLLEDKSIPIEADEEDSSCSAVKELFERNTTPPSWNLEPRGWVWNSFAQIREECMRDLHKDYLPKFGHLPKFELLHSPDFLPTVSQVIIEEGLRLHIPLRDGEYIVSDFDGEISSSVACALALMDLRSDSDESTGLKRTASEPWPLSSSYDSDVIPSSSSMSLTESHLSSFDGLYHLDFSYGQIHPEVTLGPEKHPVKGKYSVAIMYANEFRGLRDRCCPSELDYITSLSRCKIWDAKGGKSRSIFAKTLDERLIIKEIKKTEFDSFMKFASDYFRHMKESVESGNQTCLAKILGIYQITIRDAKSGRETKHDLMVQENLSFGRNITRQYDLKGALHARFTATSDGVGDVLLDQNFVNDMNSSPLYVGQKAKRLLQRAVWNDTTFLNSIRVMDYSLLVGVDRQRRELVCGIIDYLRQYTWDKQFETWVKASLVVPRNASPTIVSPQEYKKRFRKFMDTHFLTVPDHWCSQRSSNPCKLCGFKGDDSSQVKSVKREEELNGFHAHE